MRAARCCATSRSRRRPTTSRRLVDDARDAPGVHLLNFEFRFDPLRRRTRDLVQSGVLGTVEHVTWTHHQRGIAPSVATLRLAVRPGTRRRLDRRVGVARGRHAALHVRRDRVGGSFRASADRDRTARPRRSRRAVAGVHCGGRPERVADLARWRDRDHRLVVRRVGHVAAADHDRRERRDARERRRSAAVGARRIGSPATIWR